MATDDTVAQQALDEIKRALVNHFGSIQIVRTFNMSTGKQMTGVQVKVKSRKVGPLLFPTEGEDLSDLMKMIGTLALKAYEEEKDA